VLGGAPSVAGGGGAAGEVTGGEAGMSGLGGMGGAAAVELTDAQIVLVLDTLNAGEVEEAYAALPRLSSDDVVAFAQRMISDHSAGRQMVTTAERDLDLEPMPSDVQASLEQEAREHVDQFHEGSGAIDAAYIQLQIEEHAQALDLLAKLEQAADAAALRDLITALRATVQEHEELARQVQASL
jgi:putative membrane protein